MTTDRNMTCPLCQFMFDDRNACHGCGITRHCTMVKCPNCGYEFVEHSRTVALFGRLLHWLKGMKKESESHDVKR